MSSAGVAVAPLAVPVIVAAGAVAVVGGTAVLMVRAAGAATEVLAAGAERLGDAVAQAAEKQLDLQRSARLWEQAAAEVVSLNARIAVVAATARGAGVSVDLPATYRPDCCQLAEIHKWCVAAEASLRTARQRLDGAAAEQERSYFAAATTGVPASAEVLARHQQRLRERHAQRRQRPEPPVPPAAEVPARIEGEISQWLGRLAADATAAERRAVLARAATVSHQADPGTAWTYLDQLKADIKAVNASVAQRRLAAQWLVALEHPSVAGEPDPPVPGLTRRLRAVLDGDAELDPRLRAEAGIGLRWAEGVVDRAFLHTSVRECLQELGYDEDAATELDITQGAAARMVRPNWGGDHFAEVRTEGEQVTLRVVRRHGAVTAEAAASDADRCEDLIDDLDQVRTRLRARGVPVGRIAIDHTVDREAAPAKVDTSTAATTPKQRYHQ